MITRGSFPAAMVPSGKKPRPKPIKKPKPGK